MAGVLLALHTKNALRWKAARLTRGPEFAKYAKRALAYKDTYVEIATRCGMPQIAWVFIAAAHYRESSQDFSKSLAQGDPWNRVSTHVPRGRGPFKSFVEAAVDALVNCPPYSARHTDWSIAGILTLLERYNGLGYANRTLPSPYVWSGTDQYARGKFVSDGKFSPYEVDKQLGCAGLIMAIMKLDPTVRFDTTPSSAAPAAPAPVIAASPPTARRPSSAPDPYSTVGKFLNTLYSLVQGFLKRKS